MEHAGQEHCAQPEVTCRGWSPVLSDLITQGYCVPITLLAQGTGAEGWLCLFRAVSVPPLMVRGVCSPRQPFLEERRSGESAFQNSRGTVSTAARESTTLASLCAVCGFSHPQACCQGLVGECQPHTYTGCKLTSEFQLCCFSASGHFHVGLGSLCEISLWGRMCLGMPHCPLRQGPSLLGPSLGRVLWEPSVPGTGLNRESQGRQAWLQGLIPCSF